LCFVGPSDLVSAICVVDDVEYESGMDPGEFVLILLMLPEPLGLFEKAVAQRSWVPEFCASGKIAAIDLQMGC